MNRKYSFRLLTLSLVLVVLAALYIRLPGMVARIIHAGMVEAGLADVRVTGVGLDWGRIHIKELSFIYPAARQGDGTVTPEARVELRGAALLYSLDALREHRVDRIELMQAQFILDSKRLDKKPTQQVVREQKKQDRSVPVLPFRDLQIHRLAFSWSGVSSEIDTLHGKLGQLVIHHKGSMLEWRVDEKAEAALASATTTIETGSWRLAELVLPAVSGELNLASGQAGLLLPGGSGLVLRGSESDRVNLPLIEAVLDEQVEIGADLATGSIGSGPVVLAAKIPELVWDKESLKDTDVRLELDKVLWAKDKWSGQGKLKLTGLYAGSFDLKLDVLTLDSVFSLDQDQLNADISLESSGKPVTLQATVQHSLMSRQGSVHVVMPAVQLKKGVLQLSHFLGAWPYGFDFEKGTVKADGRLAWGGGGIDKLRFEVGMQELGGHYNELLLSGLSANAIVTKHKDSYEVSSRALTIARLDTGVKLSNVRSAITVTLPATGGQPVVVLKDLQGRVLDGIFSSEHVLLDLGKEENRLVLNVDQIDLSRVLELHHQEGLSGSGVIAGRIPVRITKQGVVIEQGELWAQEPGGEIHYRTGASGDALTQGNPQMKLLMDTLDNFHYHQLSSKVQFAQDGELQLAVELKGRNPDMHGGREVHLNLNVEQNVFALLKSLRFADDISGAIGKKYNK